MIDDKNQVKEKASDKMALAKQHLKNANDMIQHLRGKAKHLNQQAEHIANETRHLRKAIKRWETTKNENL